MIIMIIVNQMVKFMDDHVEDIPLGTLISSVFKVILSIRVQLP